jgi:hypothetical protein
VSRNNVKRLNREAWRDTLFGVHTRYHDGSWLPCLCRFDPARHHKPGRIIRRLCCASRRAVSIARVDGVMTGRASLRQGGADVLKRFLAGSRPAWGPYHDT